MRQDRHAEKRHRQEADHTFSFLRDPEQSRLSQTWFDAGTVDAWRHGRMYACLNPLLEGDPGARWLTVGDGRYGIDAQYLLGKGASALATCLNDALLAVAAKRGLLPEFQAANAEDLPFEAESFDYVLCKESYHHFARPMLALYEMLRVARKGVVLIEPSEAPRAFRPTVQFRRWLKHRLQRLGFRPSGRTLDTSILRPWHNGWESVGNYVYTISQREMEKAALGLGFPACAFKGLNDYYEPGVETEPARPDSELFRRVQARIAAADRRCEPGPYNDFHGLMAAILFKKTPGIPMVDSLKQAGYDWRPLPQNPAARPDAQSSGS